jgi:hypothetical protein
VNRRDFLRGISASIAAAVFGKFSLWPKQKPPDPNRTVGGWYSKNDGLTWTFETWRYSDFPSPSPFQIEKLYEQSRRMFEPVEANGKGEVI